MGRGKEISMEIFLHRIMGQAWGDRLKRNSRFTIYKGKGLIYFGPNSQTSEKQCNDGTFIKIFDKESGFLKISFCTGKGLIFAGPNSQNVKFFEFEGMGQGKGT